jgi:hypothetical protein
MPVNELLDTPIPLTPSTKRQVPKYIATKCFIMSCIASHWFAASVVVFWDSQATALCCAIFALAVSVVAAWFKYAESQEDKLFKDLRG